MVRRFENLLEYFDHVGGSMAGIATIILVFHLVYNSIYRNEYLKGYMTKTKVLVHETFKKHLTKEEEKELDSAQKEVIERCLSLENFIEMNGFI